MRRNLFVVSAIVVVLLLVSVSVIVISNSSHPTQMPIKPLPMISETFTPSRSLNTSQGSTFEINITLSSILDTELSLPFESLEVMAFNNTPADIPQGKLFSYSFSKNPLIIPANGTSSTTLTVTMADNASVGRYLLYLKYGNSNITYVGGSNLFVDVEPAKTTSGSPSNVAFSYHESSREAGGDNTQLMLVINATLISGDSFTIDYYKFILYVWLKSAGGTYYLDQGHHFDPSNPGRVVLDNKNRSAVFVLTFVFPTGAYDNNRGYFVSFSSYSLNYLDQTVELR